MVKEEKGQAVVELALVLPILLVLLVGIFDIGRIIYSYASLHFTAQETARISSFGKSDAEIIEFAKNQFTAGDTTQLDVSLSLPEGERDSGDYVTITLTYPIIPVIPVVRNVLPEQILLSVNSTIRIE
ncbi:TadE/TadG family type IV pilus assembly protein [Aquibacillus salsiterrae]|uniref:Pilus assembly protein n=1 Tax=Aquibacillus salsiterrae TaxID=2950439 RepID=A0A9X3WGC7_9BACI|nr:TadE/TadG family type IV pilus assembly protein [Aquibacillus salsiterrae]MDC3416944.1 pilus assembly protein [Aquibacillus salsiterrae]